MNLTYSTYFARDVDRMAQFYIDALGLQEIVASAGGGYREVRAGPVKIGFAHQGAYAMLDLDDENEPTGLRSILTFDVGSAENVGAAVDRAVAAGAALVKPAYATHFGTLHAVLLDPEGNALRISAPLAS